MTVSSTESMPPVALDQPAPAPTVSTDAANRAFSTSILISATRCTLTYIVFPWLLPAVGIAGGVGPGLGIVIGLVAIGFNVASIRRFFAANHPWRVPISSLNCIVICMLTYLVISDISQLVS